jgi:outer membrane protein
MFRRTLLFAALALTAAAQPPPELPARLTLSDAVSIALRQSPLLRRAAAHLQQAEAQVQQTVSQWHPQFSFGYQHFGQTLNLQAMGIRFPFLPSRVGPFETVDVRAYMTQNVLNLPLRERDRAGRTQREVVRSLAGDAREELAYQVALVWTNALRAQQAHATLAEQTDLSRKLARITADRRELGVASGVELKRSQQQVNNLEQAVAEAENNLVAAKLQLAALLNGPVQANFELDGEQTPAAEPLAADRALAAAFSSRLDYRAAQQQVQAAEHRIAAARAQRYPLVQFRADYGQSGISLAQNLNTYRLQGSVTVPLYTGGRIEGEVTEAEGRLAEARATLDELRARVSADVLAALTAVRTARRQVEVSTETVALARDELELVTLRFTSSVADNTEVVNAQDRLTRAEDARVRALFQWNLAQAALHRAIGDGEQFYLSRKNP